MEIEIQIAIIGSFLAMVGLIASLYFSTKESRQSSKAHYADIITSLGTDLDDQLKDEYDLDKQHKCEIYAEMYMDKLDRIAYLATQEKLPTYSPSYFKKYFRYGQTLMKWYIECVKVNEQTLADHWINLQNWNREKGITDGEAYDEDYLPPKMREILESVREEEKKKN